MICVCAWVRFYFISATRQRYFFRKTFLHVFVCMYILPQKSFRISDPLIGFDLSPGPRASRSLPWDHDPFVKKKNFASLTCLFLAPFTAHRSCQSGWFPYRKTVFVLTPVKKRPWTSHVYCMHSTYHCHWSRQTLFYVSLWILNR